MARTQDHFPTPKFRNTSTTQLSLIPPYLPLSLLSTTDCNAAAHAVAHTSLASQRRPNPLIPPSRNPTVPTHPRHASLNPRPPPPSTPPPPFYTPGDLHPADPETKTSVLHPRVAVLLGVDKQWHLPLLFCRALSTAPAVWWGLRCALTFMGELLMEEGLDKGLNGAAGAPWSVERRFRVTEVFLAVLWVWYLQFLSTSEREGRRNGCMVNRS